MSFPSLIYVFWGFGVSVIGTVKAESYSRGFRAYFVIHFKKHRTRAYATLDPNISSRVIAYLPFRNSDPKPKETLDGKFIHYRNGKISASPPKFTE